jgi:hypothetical protein
MDLERNEEQVGNSSVELDSPDKNTMDKKTPTGPRANPLYKTRLCMNFQTTGSCPYTEKCQFAHGVTELEKWESWRVSHKPDENSKRLDTAFPSLHSMSDNGSSRSRSISGDTRREICLDSFDDHEDSHSINHLNWDSYTPVKLEENSPYFSSPQSFSLWSVIVDEIEGESSVTEHSDGDRGRSATVDSTYDNMSQLRDAPTLFSVPPILPKYSKSKPSN